MISYYGYLLDYPNILEVFGNQNHLTSVLNKKFNLNLFLRDQQLNSFDDLLQEYQFQFETNQNEDNLLFYFIDGDGDKVVIQNDYDFKEFIKLSAEFLKITVEQKDKEDFAEIVYHNDIKKDAIKKKIMKLLEYY